MERKLPTFFVGYGNTIKLMNYMYNLRIVISVVSLFVIRSAAFAGIGAEMQDKSEVESTSAGVTLKVKCLPTYATNRDVIVNYSIVNNGKRIVKMIHANGIHDVHLELTGPDGKRITAFHDIGGDDLFGGQFKRFYVDALEENEEGSGDPLELFLFYPLNLPGEYRFIMTKRIYLQDTLDSERRSILRPGVPVDIVAPELRFRISSIDKSYSSPVEQAIKKLKQSRTDESQAVRPEKGHGDKTTSDTSRTTDGNRHRWSIFAKTLPIVLIVFTIWLFFFMRRNKA